MNSTTINFAVEVRGSLAHAQELLELRIGARVESLAYERGHGRREGRAIARVSCDQAAAKRLAFASCRSKRQPGRPAAVRLLDG